MNRIDFLDEEAVKEYVDQIGVEYRQNCFTDHLPDGCHRLGDWLEFAKRDWNKAGRVYKSNCDLYNHAHSCAKFAQYAYLGRGLPAADVATGVEYVKKACDNDNPFKEACGDYAILLENGSREPADPLESRRYWEKGCALNDATSCHGAFASYFREGPFQDFNRAIELAKKGCDLKEYPCCARLAMMYENGVVLPKSEEYARKYHEKAEAIKKANDPNQPGVTFGQ